MSKPRTVRSHAIAAMSACLPALLGLSCTVAPIDRLGGADTVMARFLEIHSQVYRVYSVGMNRDAVHDRLSAAFAGEALTREYVEHWTTLARMRDEGTAIDVLSVDYESVAVAGSVPNGVLVEADWSVGGIVTHQSHKHHRINRYQAVYTMAMASTDGETPALHIVDTRVRNAERVATPLESSGAGSFPLDELPRSERGYLGPAELLRSGILDQGGPAGAQPPGATSPQPTPAAPAPADGAAEDAPH